MLENLTQDEDLEADEPRRIKKADLPKWLLNHISCYTTIIRGDDTEFWLVIESDYHRECWSLESDRVKDWFSKLLYEGTGCSASSEVLGEVVRLLKAGIDDRPAVHPIHLRAAATDGTLHIDLRNDEWQSIQINDRGWMMMPRPPCFFKRLSGGLPLPLPRHGGELSMLRRYINLRSDSDFLLIIA